MPQLNQKDHILTTQYYFIKCLPWISIAIRIDKANPDQIHKFYTHLKTRHLNASPSELVNITGQKKKQDNTTHIQPGSNASLKIQEYLQNTEAQHGQVEAANYTLQQMRGNNARESLKKLSNKQIHNIYMNRAHCKQDLINNHPLPRKRALEKPSLNKLDLPDQQQYIDQILSFQTKKTLLICIDETPITFKSS